MCPECGVRPRETTGRWLRATCKMCRRKPWVKYKGESCELCGFVPVHIVQLDVDHIDGNKLNNCPENLQTLCANCHRLKTWLNNDHLQKEEMELDSMQLSLLEDSND